MNVRIQRELNGEIPPRGRRPKYSRDIQREIARRYDIYRINRPQVLSAEFGISEKTLRAYWRKLKRQP